MTTATYDHLAREGETFEQTVTFTEEEISRVATALGDTNPLHHDPA